MTLEKTVILISLHICKTLYIIFRYNFFSSAVLNYYKKYVHQIICIKDDETSFPTMPMSEMPVRK